MPPEMLTWPHPHSSDVLLAQEVPDLHKRAIVLYDYIDWEVSVHRPHLVAKALGYRTYPDIETEHAQEAEHMHEAYKRNYSPGVSTASEKAQDTEPKRHLCFPPPAELA